MRGGCQHEGVTRRRVRVRDVELHVEVEGDGPPLLLVHGGPGGDHRMLHPDLSMLAGLRRLFYVDLRGHGESGWPDTEEHGWGAEVDADDLAELIPGIAGGPADVLGYSYGGIVALHLAARRPEVVRRLALVSTPVGATMADVERTVAADPRSLAFDAATTDDERFEAFLRFYLEREPGPEKRASMRAVNECFRTERTRRLLAARAVADDRETDRAGLLRAVSAPLLLLHGRHDPIVPGERLRAAVACRPGTTVAEFPESRHDPFHDEPERFLAAMAEFLG